jgi:membrane-associated phospholipid phosphatase
MLWSWGTVGFIYGTTRFMPGERWIIPETRLDLAIPFNASGIWMYLAFFLFVPWAFLSSPAARVPALRGAIQLSALISGIIFILFPTSLNYPTLFEPSIHASALELLLAIDTAQNCLPSLHAALTSIALASLWQPGHYGRNFCYLAIAIAIGFSIIQLRRHLLIDVTAGIIVGLVSHGLATRFIRTTISKGARNHE